MYRASLFRRLPWDDLDTWDSWTQWAQQANSPLVYEHPIIDVGTVTAFRPIINLTFEGGSSSVELSHSTDNLNYSPYTPADGSEITTRYLKVKLTINKNQPSDYPMIRAARLLLAATPLSEFIEDLNTASLSGPNRLGVGHIKLPLRQAFAAIKGVTLTLQNVGSGWSYELIAKTDTSNGPEIKLYDSNGNPADAVIDAQIRGV